MITDVFHKRYPGVFNFYQSIPREIPVFLRQGAQIIFQDLKPYIRDTEQLCKTAYTKLVRELGHGIHDGSNAEDVCIGALCESYDFWNNAHGSSNQFFQYRFSLLELLMAELEAEILTPKANSRFKLFKKSQPEDNAQSERNKDAFRSAVQELNYRMREAGLPFHYHNGIFQHGTDRLTELQVHEPFWTLIQDTKWQNIEMDIKEAIDRRDHNGRDSALYALKALESTIKIISDENGWSRGTERGVANYIDNLVSAANGRFIDVWESEQLKALFRDLRNPHGHGPGSAPQPTVSVHQESWIIECSMIWIKSLISRI